MGLFSKSNEHVLGVDIGAGGVKMVELVKSGKRPKLFTYGIANASAPIIHMQSETPEEEEKAIGLQATRLRKVFDASKCQATKAAASIPVSHVSSLMVRVPEGEPKTMQEQAEAQAIKLLPYPVEEMVLDTRIMKERMADLGEKKSKKTREVMVVATLSKIVERYSKIFAKANIPLDSLETEAFALVRALVGNDPSAVMIVDIGTERTNFFMVERGIPRTQRSISLGGATFTKTIQEIVQVEKDEAEQIKKDLSRSENPDAQKIVRELLDRSLKPIIKEIDYGFMLFSEQIHRKNTKPEKIILTGGSSGIPQLGHMLEQNFQIKSYIGDPWARVLHASDLKPVLHSIGPRMSVTLGLAMRLAM